MSLSQCRERYDESITGMRDWCSNMYDSIFAKYFDSQRSISLSIRSNLRPISDDELEKILTEVPMNLFDASEALSSIRTESEIIKLEVKRRELEAVKNSQESSEVKRKEEAAILTTEDKILLMAYDNLITRVEKEMSYSRELIMSAKKIWDSRKGGLNPVSEVNPSLPDYDYHSTTGSNPCEHKTYIK